MSYQKDSDGRVWQNGGVIVENCGPPWDEYLAWLAEGNKPTERTEE